MKTKGSIQRNKIDVFALSSKYLMVVLASLTIISSTESIALDTSDDALAAEAARGFKCAPKAKSIKAGANFCLGYFIKVLEFSKKQKELQQLNEVLRALESDKFLGTMVTTIDKKCSGSTASPQSGYDLAEKHLNSGDQAAIQKLAQFCPKIIEDHLRFAETADKASLTKKLRSRRSGAVTNALNAGASQGMTDLSNLKVRLYCQRGQKIESLYYCMQPNTSLNITKEGKTNYYRLQHINGLENSPLVGEDKVLRTSFKLGDGFLIHKNMVIEIVNKANNAVIFRERIDKTRTKEFTYKGIIREVQYSGMQKCEKLCDLDFVKTASKADYEAQMRSSSHLNTINKENGWTPLMYALQYQKDPELISFVIEKSSVQDVFTKQGIHALHLAAKYHSTDIFNKLRDKSKDKSPKTDWNEGVLHFAVQNSSSNTADLLIEGGADTNARTKGDWVPLNYAARYGSNTTILKKLINSNPELLQSVGKKGWNLLLSAAQGSSNRDANAEIAILETLIELGLSPNSLLEDGRNAIHVAAGINFDHGAEVIKFLVKAGVNIDATSNDKQTALHKAAGTRNLETANVLLDLGIDPNVEDKNRNTALLTSVWQTKADVSDFVKLLLKNGAIAGATNKDNFSAYGLAMVNKVVADKTVMEDLLSGAQKTRRNQVFAGSFFCQDEMWVGSSYRAMGDDGGHYAVMYELLRQRNPQMEKKYICANKKWERKGDKLRPVSNDMKGLGGVYAVRDADSLYVYVDNVFSKEM